MAIETTKFSVQEIILAGDQGPCGGVNMADQATRRVLQLVDGRRPVVALWDVLHNKPYMEEMCGLGLILLDEITPVEDSRLDMPTKIRRHLRPGSIVIQPAHGSYLQIAEAIHDAGCHSVDVTCQLVEVVQRAAVRAAEQGYWVIYLGVDNHPETNSVIKRLAAGTYTFLDVRDYKGMTLESRQAYLTSLAIPSDKSILVCNQTTLSPGDLRDAKADLASHYDGQLLSLQKGNICYAMHNRWEAVVEMAESGIIDLLLVVGSPHSHNSQELRLKGLSAQLPSFSVDTPDQIDPTWFTQSIQRVGVTSGASVFPKYRDAVVSWLLQENPHALVTQLPRTERELTFALPQEQIDQIEAFIQRTERSAV